MTRRACTCYSDNAPVAHLGIEVTGPKPPMLAGQREAPGAPIVRRVPGAFRYLNCALVHRVRVEPVRPVSHTLVLGADEVARSANGAQVPELVTVLHVLDAASAG